MPILEPSNCQEVKDMVKYAFDLSEQFKLPVIVRTTTRVSHMRGVVEFGEVVDNSSEGESHWKKDFQEKPCTVCSGSGICKGYACCISGKNG